MLLGSAALHLGTVDVRLQPPEGKLGLKQMLEKDFKEVHALDIHVWLV